MGADGHGGQEGRGQGDGVPGTPTQQPGNRVMRRQQGKAPEDSPAEQGERTEVPAVSGGMRRVLGPQDTGPLAGSLRRPARPHRWPGTAASEGPSVSPGSEGRRLASQQGPGVGAPVSPAPSQACHGRGLSSCGGGNHWHLNVRMLWHFCHRGKGGSSGPGSQAPSTHFGSCRSESPAQGFIPSPGPYLPELMEGSATPTRAHGEAVGDRAVPGQQASRRGLG